MTQQLFSVHCKPDVSPETARALADMLLHAVVVRTPDPIAELLREARERAEVDLTAGGHAPSSIERTEAMASLRSWIARLDAVIDPERETVSATCEHCGHVTAYAIEPSTERGQTAGADKPVRGLADLRRDGRICGDIPSE